MKTLLTLGAALILAGNLLAADLLPPGRVVFFGDSITHAGDYVVDTECALLARGEKHEVINLGLPSESCTKLTDAEQAGHIKAHHFGHPYAGDRTGKSLEALHPSTVFIAYGMNDAGAMIGFVDEATAVKRCLEAITALREDALKSGAKRVICLTPTTREVKGSLDNPGEKTLQALAAALLAKKTAGWEVVDFHAPMRTALEERRAKNPKFRFADDGVHPNEEGHALMATQLIGNLVSNESGKSPKTAPAIRPLVKQRMVLLRNAWLAKIGHKRPGMAKGLSVEVAEKQAAEMGGKIDATLAKR